jgi:hypothetical protein
MGAGSDLALKMVISLKDEASEPAKKLKEGLGGLGNIAGTVAKAGLIAAAAGVTALAAGLAATIGPASDLNETVSKVGVVFGDQATKVMDFAKTSATALGMTQNEALAAAGTYGNLFRSMGMTEKASATMSTGLVQLAADLASFNNMNPNEVLDKLRAGLTGESEPLKSLGVNINEDILKMKALEMGLYSGKGTLDASAKAQASYALILKQTSLAQGDFARTSDGLANQQRILTATLGNLRSTIGTALLPVVNKLAAGLINALNSPKFQAASAAFTSVISNLAGGNVLGAINSLHDGLLAFLPASVADAIAVGMLKVQTGVSDIKKWFDANGPAIKAHFDAWRDVAKKLGDGDVLGAINGLHDELLKLLPAPVADAIALALLKVQTGLSDLKTWIDANGPAIKTGMEKIWTGIQAAGTAALPLVKEQVNSLVTTWETVLTENQPYIVSIWQGLMNNLGKIGTGVTAPGEGGGQSLAAQFVTQFQGEFDRQLGDVKTGIRLSMRALSGDVWGAFLEGIGSSPEDFSRLQTRIVTGISGMQFELMKAWQNLWNGLGSIHIPLPHISIGTKNTTAAGITFPVPDVGVDWYGQGLPPTLFTQPTMIGVGDRREVVTITPEGQQPGASPVTFIINNPIGQTTETSILRALQVASYLGVSPQGVRV